jgi:hypothetical protein
VRDMLGIAGDDHLVQESSWWLNFCKASRQPPCIGPVS